MTVIEDTYMLFVDQYGTLRLQMHGAPRSMFVGGLAEVEPSGEIAFVPSACPPAAPSPEDGPED